MHISLAAETLFRLWGFPVTNSFLTAVLLSLALIVTGFFIRRQVGNLSSGFYNAVEMIVEGLDALVRSVVANAALAKRVVPLAGTIFLFVLLSNWIGLLPFVGSVGFTHVEAPHTEAAVHESAEEPPVAVDAAATDSHAEPAALTEAAGPHDEGAIVVAEPAAEEAHEGAPHAEAPHTDAPHTSFAPLFRAAYSDLNMTLALALVAMAMVQYFGFSALGVGYLGKFFTFKNPILAAVGLLEIISEIVKIFSFSFRLFGNIFAGEVLLTVIAALVPFIGPVPFLGIEAFAGAIQALIFTMLTLVFITSAATPHEHPDDEHAPHGAAVAAH